MDDDEDFGRRAARTLDDAGFIARFHRGPRGTLQAIRQMACDVVLLDVNMPQLDGPRLMRMIRETYPATRIRVVLCSDMHESALQRLADRLGADGAIQKSEDGQELVESLRKALLAEPSSRAHASTPGGGADRREPTTGEASGLEVALEAPDLVVLKARGAVAGARGNTALCRVEEWAGPRPYFLLLFDVSEAIEIDASARDHMSAWARRVPPHAMAAFGADFHIRVVLEMIQRAVSSLTGKRLHRHFSQDEAAARAWLDKMRPGVGEGM